MIDEATTDRLIEAARLAQQRAYCPYSHFPVGAAILTNQDKIILGCNVENASYGLTICAERNAMTRCVTDAAGEPIAIAIVGNTTAPISPCGACRQFLAEFNPEMTVVCEGTSGGRFVSTVRELLPGAFDREDLEETKDI